MLTLRAPQHRDVRHVADVSLGGLRFILLCDPLVSCDVDVHILRGGTADPLVTGVLAQLSRRTMIGVEELGARLQLTTAPLQRVLNETLRALARAGYVTLEGRDVRGHSREFPMAQLLTSSEAIAFHPPAQQRFPLPKDGDRHRTSLDATRLEEFREAHPDVPLQEPFWNELYTEQAVDDAIRDSYARELGSSAGRIPNEFDRHEILQRARLQLRGDRLIGVTVRNRRYVGRFVLHRCYLYRSSVPGGFRWVPLVKRYSTPIVAERYTSFLWTEFGSAPEVLKELLRDSRAVAFTDRHDSGRR